jgi:ferritin-like metal-binding protein YciE
MDASTNVLAEEVRAKRVAVDNDLELLRVRLSQADPRRMIDMRRWARTGVPVVAGLAGLMLLARRRRRVNTLDQLLLRELADLYRMERMLVPALERMSRKATDPELRNAFESHRLETEGHVERLERVFRSLRARPRKGADDVLSAVMQEGERLMRSNVTPDVRDAWLIATAQRVEHMEIAGYGTARTYAETLGYTYAADLLQQTLEEERTADERLTGLAERFVNPRSVKGAKTLGRA